MAGDLIREVRRGTVSHLKADVASKALVPVANMHPSTTPPTPAWPFSRMDSFQSSAIDASCVTGATVTFQLHGFAKPKMQGTSVIETAEDQASRIGTAFKIAIHNTRVPIDGGWFARLRVLSVRLLRDGDEEDAYHVVLSVEARVLAA
ncbi:DUF3168 domain-containing protein [Sphingomonas faeni]|uniref:DUF3168 domain-containing protein n=1 Tax=Sphingomonas faeni TaxID=185950 RepID=UPI003357A889